MNASDLALLKPINSYYDTNTSAAMLWAECPHKNSKAEKVIAISVKNEVDWHSNVLVLI